MKSNASKDCSNPFNFWKEKDSEATTTTTAKKNGTEVVGTGKKWVVTLKPQIQQCTPQRSFNSRSPFGSGSSLARSSTVLREGEEGRLKLQPADASSDPKRHPSPRPAAPIAAHHDILNKDDLGSPARSRSSSPCSSSYSSSSECPTKSFEVIEPQRREVSDRKERFSSKSDASSYTPLGDSLFGSVSSRKSSTKRKVGNALSNPEQVNPPPQTRTTIPSQESKFAGVLESSQLRTKKFVPKISTIRGSTGDRLSMDDMELYNLQRTGKVQDLAKQMGSVLLIPRQSSSLHGSTGDINRMTRSATPSSSPPGLSRSSTLSLESSASLPEVRPRILRSQTTTKVRSSPSVKIRSSGFISYLDGPVDVPLFVTPPPPLSPPPPPSPLLEMSNFLKDRDIREGNHLQPCSSSTQETTDFWEMVQRIQTQYCAVESSSLTSPVLSHTIQHPSGPSAVQSRHDSMCFSARETKEVVMVRVVESGMSAGRDGVEFICNVKSIVYSVLTKAIDLLRRGGLNKGITAQNCGFKVRGRDEILEDKRLLRDYEYIHQCRKFSVPVELVVVEKKSLKHIHLMKHSFPGKDSSTLSSSCRSSLTSTNIYSPHVSKCLTMKESNYLLDGYHAKDAKFRTFLVSKQGPNSPLSIPTMVQSVVSCVKLLCERMSFIEPPEITDAIFNLRRACKAATQPEIQACLFGEEDCGSLSSSSASDNWVAVPDKIFCISEDDIEDVIRGLDVLHKAVHQLVSLYCSSFHPGYNPKWDHAHRAVTNISSAPERLLKIKIAALHRPYLDELQKYDTLQIECTVYHGGKALSKKSYSPHAKLARSFGNTVVWNKWLNMSISLSSLYHEARVMFTLHGLEFPVSSIKWSRTPIASTILRLFSSKGCLLSGAHVLAMWLGEDTAPLDSPYHNMHNKRSMLLQVELEDRGEDVYYSCPTTAMSQSKTKLPGPPPNVSRTLTSLAQKDRFYNMTTSDQKLVWVNRLACVSLLGSYSRGLPVVLLSAKHSDVDKADVQKIVNLWKFTDPVNGLDLLDPLFADMVVRKKAVEWLSVLSNDDICDFLPQLVLSVKYDCYLSSPMVEFLLQRSIQSRRIAHSLFWHLRLALATNIRFRGRYEPILQALKHLCGECQQQEFSNQVELVEQLRSVAMAVKNTRDSHRQTTLVKELQGVANKFLGKFRLPLNPALLVKSIDIESCSFFNSNTVPLKLSFTNADPFGDNINIIFKVGDDLRQDILILQMIRLMEKIWLRAGLDLKMITYQCVATAKEEGMLELVQEAATLRTIQMEHGVTGSFKDKPLSEWLQRHNPTESAYRQAVKNFTLSCAGYCVATYVLGICDRHNDNIMVKKSGHMFHIDFGKILGNAQMLGNIRRDRAPFVLTRDMAYVINDGDKPTAKFQQFCDLCCNAYNELRKHTTLFVSLLSLILSSGLPEVSSLEDVQYVRDALLPGKSEPEATYAFTKYIEDSLGSMATTLNFFIHNLAQFKFSSSTNASSLLSFCPQTYSIATSGGIESAIITTYHKWFYPETYYVYQIEVKRASPEKEKIFRRYREFDELQNKLLQCFPDSALPQLPRKILIPGKSHTKQTSEHRMVELNMYLASLLSMPTHISESDIIYTFLQCLIRDEQDLAKLREDEVEDCDYSSGEVKLEMLYNSKQEVLSVMVRHVKGLVPREGYDSADPYVKLYLLPDANKSTKQKTKITRKTLNPTYNETFCYSLPLLSLKKRALQLSIWDASNVLGNHCLCMTTIELSRLMTQLNSDTNFVEWFELFSIPNL